MKLPRTNIHTLRYEDGCWLPVIREPVFGPERPNAALAAIRELEDAQREYDSHGGFAPSSVIRRLRVARANRAQYAEYGDTFRGH